MSPRAARRAFRKRQQEADRREFIGYRVLDVLRKAALSDGHSWLKRSELSAGVMRHVEARDRTTVLSGLVGEALVDEAVRRRAHGPGAPAMCYQITKKGRKRYETLLTKYSDGLYHSP